MMWRKVSYIIMLYTGSQFSLADDDIFAAPARPKKKQSKKPAFEELLDDDSDLFATEKEPSSPKVRV